MEKITKEALKKKELNKLNRIFKNLPDDKKKFAEGLKRQAAFMFATLAELQEQIDDEGVVEVFTQGAQSMLREHPATKVYNSMIKNYTTVCKQLLDMLPADDRDKNEDELMAFVKKARK